ncbi:hypothetical protein SOASR014_41790 [Pectobacterium carotovorum subsp. carotovorum]|nr:hypothetical protein SOASR014_41790 [Pectobacterium carotovorum subsp. carotovorum]GLX46544.1 hypothetical protein Pcaca01_42120 [Pectobacterium carotovorum subsp. carotovorum]
MAKTYHIIAETESGETFTGVMTRKQPELVNGFIAIATDSGTWVYLKPDTVTKITFTPQDETE